MTNKKAIFHLVWGLLLLIAGIGVFFRIPQVMPTIETIENFADLGWFIRFCFYLMGILLIGGGIQKIVRNYKIVAGQDS